MKAVLKIIFFPIWMILVMAYYVFKISIQIGFAIVKLMVWTLLIGSLINLFSHPNECDWI